MRFYWKVTVIASMLLSSCISHHSSFSVLSVEGGRIEITSDLDKSPDTAEDMETLQRFCEGCDDSGSGIF